jgi:hypothetical protein
LKMNITRSVIQDLLPLYLANEVSEDTRALVEAYLEYNPDLAAQIERFKTEQISADFPMVITPDKEMEAYRQAKRLLAIRTLILAIFIAAICIIPVLMFFFSST